MGQSGAFYLCSSLFLIYLGYQALLYQRREMGHIKSLMMVCFFLFLPLLSNLSEAADRWKLYDVSRLGQDYAYDQYYDSESIVSTNKNIYKVWIKHRNKSQQLINITGEETDGLLEIDCSKRQLRILEEHLIFKSSGRDEYSIGTRDWRNIKPESSDEKLF